MSSTRTPGIGNDQSSAEHPHKALRRRARHGPQLLEADGGLYVVAQDRFAGIDITGKHRIDCFSQQRWHRTRAVITGPSSFVFLDRTRSRRLASAGARRGWGPSEPLARNRRGTARLSTGYFVGTPPRNRSRSMLSAIAR